MEFNDQLLGALRANRAAALMEYKGRDYTYGEISDLSDRVVALLDEARVPRDAKVGVVTRNRVLHAAAMLGLIGHRRALTTVYAIQSPEAIAKEIAASQFGAVIADAQDWTEPVRAATSASATAGIVLSHGRPGEPLALVPGLEKAGAGPFAKLSGEPGLEILSSGTTGKPKRIVLPFRLLARTIESAAAGRAETRSEPDILTWPFAGIGGTCNLLAAVMLGRHLTILDKFNVPEWVDAVRRRRPKVMNGSPTVARMLLDAKIPPEDLSSIQYFYGGSAPLPPELQEEMESTYNVKVIWAYGATEFCGSVASWTPQLHEQYRTTKQGSMGRALPGIALRVVDVDTGIPLPSDSVGYLEALVPAVKDDWIRTTDLACIDADGFVFHKGRGDGAILRGGFKVLPETIAAGMQKHPAVLEAAVVGLPDTRLGQVPAAALELKSGAPRPTDKELYEHARRELVVHHVPAHFIIVDALPRTTSMKVDLVAVKRLFEVAG